MKERKSEGSRTASSRMDMLHGSLWDKIILFAIPLAIGSILQQMFNAVDVAVVGRFASSEALAAVGANTAVVTLVLGFFIGLSVGSNVVIASYLGEGRKDKISDAVHTSMMTAFLSGILLLVVSQLIARPMLTLMATPLEVLGLAVVYLRIYALGMPFIMLYNFGAAVLRSVGDTRRPLYCLIISGALNAGLNMFFVIVCHRSVDGVALATVISNVAAGGMIIHFLLHEEEPIRLHPDRILLHKDEFVRIIKIGVPAGLQGVVFSLSNVFIQAGINSFGYQAVAGASIGQNFEFITYFMINGFNQAAVTFSSQNYGAGKIKRCLRTLLLCLAFAAVSNAVLVGVIYLNKDFMISLFTKDAGVAAYAATRLSLVLIFQWIASSYEVCGSALRGLGHSLTPALLTVLGSCVIRIIWVNTISVRYHDFHVLMACYPVTWVITGVMVVVAYIYIVRIKIS